MLASSAVDCGFEPRLGQTKDYTIGICCFSAKHAALRRKGKDWLALNPWMIFVSYLTDFSYFPLERNYRKLLDIYQNRLKQVRTG